MSCRILVGDSCVRLPDFTPWPAAVMTTVWLLGAGPGLNVDLATFTFHVPISESVCADTGTATADAKATTTPRVHEAAAEAGLLAPERQLVRKVAEHCRAVPVAARHGHADSDHDLLLADVPA